MQCKQVDIGDKCVECLDPLLLELDFSLTEYQPIMIIISVGYVQSVTSCDRCDEKIYCDED